MILLNLFWLCYKMMPLCLYYLYSFIVILWKWQWIFKKSCFSAALPFSLCVMSFCLYFIFFMFHLSEGLCWKRSLQIWIYVNVVMDNVIRKAFNIDLGTFKKIIDETGRYLMNMEMNFWKNCIEFNDYRSSY